LTIEDEGCFEKGMGGTVSDVLEITTYRSSKGHFAMKEAKDMLLPLFQLCFQE
jgi:hypothetical protein